MLSHGRGNAARLRHQCSVSYPDGLLVSHRCEGTQLSNWRIDEVLADLHVRSSVPHLVITNQGPWCLQSHRLRNRSHRGIDHRDIRIGHRDDSAWRCDWPLATRLARHDQLSCRKAETGFLASSSVIPR